MNLIEKIKKSELFPENIKNFLIESYEKNELSDEIKGELENMIQEEEVAMKEIDKKTEKKLKELGS